MGTKSVVIVLLIFLAACGKSSHETPRPVGLTDPTKEDGGEHGGDGGGGTGKVAADFAAIQKIFTANRCMNCHFTGNPRNIMVLETHAQVTAEAVRIQESLDSDFMPIGNPKMSQADKDIIREWFAAGAPEKLLDFATVSSQIFTPHCVRCHGEFSEYTKVALNLQSIKDAVMTNRMPRRSPLPDDLKAVLNAWINQGAPETVPAPTGG